MSFASSVLNKRVVISPTLNAAQWELYTDMLPGVTAVADELNEALRIAVNVDMLPKSFARDRVTLVMEANSHFGASDTEPRNILEDLLEEIYGD
jgi:hypothetical protein